MDEAGFLLAIRHNPNDDGVRLNYADLLEERGESLRATFLRLECQLFPLPADQAPAVALQQQLARQCGAVDSEWVAAVSRSPVYGCQLTGGFCPNRRWEQLQDGEKPRVRPCDACVNDVYFCDNIAAIREGTMWCWCAVAFDPRIVRQPRDLEPTAEMIDQARDHATYYEIERSRDSAEPGAPADRPGEPGAASDTVGPA